MKKALVFAFTLATFSLSNTQANAQSNTAPSTQQPQAAAAQQEQQKQLIKQEELPEAVKKSLTSDALKDWQVSEVYKVAPDAAAGQAKATYEVYFTNAEQKQAIARFDEEGKVIK
ncbi:hypothetical protein [Pontibacter liquoris]|uniref:hypothetical protein n=1 Tax=Pontibacter liquoris TaxID=2905677 RepID=UPI001FA76FCD|nr:hypothetical protein [Pontibacter liquoris]